MITKISPKFEWMRPYLELGMTFLPEEAEVSRIGAWSLNRSRGKDVHASIYQNKVGDPYRIWIHTHYHFGDEEKPFSKIDLATLLAHELAHIIDWKHTPKHSRAEAKMKAAFMVLLESQGYISEEEELK